MQFKDIDIKIINKSPKASSRQFKAIESKFVELPMLENIASPTKGKGFPGTEKLQLKSLNFA